MINTEIYGAPGQWFDYQTTNFDDESMKFKQAFIGNGGKRLQDGYGYGIDLNKPIDKSLSWCALGNFSTWSKISYYKTSEDMALIARDNRTATNFSLNASNGIYTGVFIGDVGTYNNSGTMYYGSIQRWSPEAINSYSSYNSNYSANVEPLTQIPLRNCVMVPYFRVAKKINNANNTTGMDIRDVLAWDYYGTTATGNHTTHPYILYITMLPYHLESKNSSTRTSTGTWRFSSILDEISLQKGLPKDFDKPDQEIMDMVYCYNIFNQPSAIGGWTIFGHTVNGAPVVGVPVNDIIGFTDAHTGFGNSNSNRINTIKGLVVYNHPNEVFSPAFTVNQSSQGSTTVTTKGCFHYVEYYDNGPDDNIQEWVRKQIACFGLFFTDDKSTAESGDFNGQFMCLGILDDNNVGQGFYSMGPDNENQKQWDWETTNDSDYDPTSGGSEDDPYGDSTHYLNAHSYARGGKIYGTNDTGKWINLLSDINNIDIHQDGYNESVFYGQEPIECLIEGKLVFVNGLLGGVNLDANVDIELGQHQTSVKATRIRETYPYTAKYGSIHINGIYNDFRDFEPYTSINLLLPFAGSVELPPSVAMYHDVYLYETIDLLTGDLFYTINIDDIEFGRAYGNCALELSKNGFAVSQYAQMRYSLHEQSRRSYFNAAASLLGGMSGTGIAASYGNVAGVVTQSLGGAANASNSFIDGFHTGMFNRHTATPVASSDRVSACVEYGRCIVPAIVVTSPRMVKDYTDANYKTQTGFATYKVGKIKDESGPVVCDSVNPSGLTCSAEEKRMIIEHLKKGIYIK